VTGTIGVQHGFLTFCSHFFIFGKIGDNIEISTCVFDDFASTFEKNMKAGFKYIHLVK
jgi:hypothetical protein